jgi:4-hydroxymandelate oxidase
MNKPAYAVPGTAEVVRTPVAWSSDSPYMTCREIEAAGRTALDPSLCNFIEGGAGDEITIADNRAAFSRWQLLPRHASLVGQVDTTTSVLGLPFSAPLFTAPFGMDGGLHPDGILAIARAHAALGVPIIVSRATSRSLEDIAEAAGDCPRMFQMLPVGRPQTFLALAGRARDAGYGALVITVDAATVGWRERSREDRWQPDHSKGWGTYRRADGTIDQDLLDELENIRQPIWGWKELGELCAQTGMPWLAKGVLIAEEARAAVDAGASGVYVSNHGGRELDSVPAALDALVEIVAEVGAEVPVLLDGGVRRGSDVAKAISLGAAAVGWARPSALAVAADGEAGVRRLLQLVRDELVTTMLLLGRHSIDRLDRSCVRPVASVSAR